MDDLVKKIYWCTQWEIIGSVHEEQLTKIAEHFEVAVGDKKIQLIR